jgi:glycosyltransferase involved in cell wall biosynthesis
MRILFALPGLHSVVRGAETAFEEVAKQIASFGGHEVTLIGSGQPRSGTPYRFRHAVCVPREQFEKWPKLPCLRSHYDYEELTFAPALARLYSPRNYDVTVTCGYPYTNWILSRRRFNGHRPRHVFVTQNGDWAPQQRGSEYRLFACDGLICTNPQYYERNRDRHRSVLIPNGVDPSIFAPGVGPRTSFDLPQSAPLVLMVSALILSKRVLEGIRCVAGIPGVHLAVAGDGELRDEVLSLGRKLLGDRFHRFKLPRHRMPELYRCADAFLHMSQDEPSANAYMEALATGLPIVTHDWEVTRWTLEDQGLLVDTNSEAAVRAALTRAFEARGVDNVRSRRRLIERRFAWSSIARQYLEFFATLSGRPARPAS